MSNIPDWQLPPGVDRGLWDYLHSSEMVGNYDNQVLDTPLARMDTQFCESIFFPPGRLLDLGCGTGRLCIHFAKRGFECWGVDLSEEMLNRAKWNAERDGLQVQWILANLIDLANVPDGHFDYAACLFSTLGMIRGSQNRTYAIRSIHRVLRPGGRFVLHVHNSRFRGLGRGQVVKNLIDSFLNMPNAGDVTRPQAYGGAPLTLHHFSQREICRLLTEQGFQIQQILGIDEEGNQVASLWKTYGYLIACERPEQKRN